jgi:pimeloyl-ACP methyl ester carboxylesterase
MCRSAKLSMLFVLLLIVALTACAPAATPVPPTATNPPPPTIAPTATPFPTSTPRPAYISMPMPKANIEGMFDVSGHKMRLECYGEGSPTIVLEQGWGVSLSDRVWDNVIPNLAAETRVCVYDRFNTGASESIGSHTFEQAAEEWQGLTQTARLKPPYIVVGHSFGGLFALTHASHYPVEVAGVALVDSTHLDLCAKFLAVLPTPSPDDSGALNDIREGCRSGQPEGTLEGIDLDKVGLQEIQAIKSLGDIPLIVLVAAPSNKNFGQHWPGILPDVAVKLDQVWLDAQKEYAALSSDSQLIIADHAGHYVQADEPELVVKAIFSLLDKARQK